VQSGSYNSCGGFSGGKKYRITSPKKGDEEVRTDQDAIWKNLKLILPFSRFTAALLPIVVPRALPTGSRFESTAHGQTSAYTEICASVSMRLKVTV
jgi:hypothetical protein